ncbi:hypothetical protein VPH35_024460 [Triticum aestivum]
MLAVPSLPVRCGLFETIDSVTYLFTVPEYSKWARTLPSTALNFDPFFVRGVLHHLKVYPAGFDKESAEFVAIFLVARNGPFDHIYNTNEGRCRLRMGYVRFVKRSELEWSSCVCRQDDSFTIRCTVFIDVDVEVRKLPAKVFAAEQIVQAWKPAAGTTGASYTMTIAFFSNVRAFSFGGGSWYLKVYPNGYCDASRDWVSVFLGRARSDETETTAEFHFEVIGLAGAGEAEHLRHTFDQDNPTHGSPFVLKTSDLTLVEQIDSDNDRLIIRCHLRVINTTTARLPPTTEPPAAIAFPPSDRLKHHLKVPARSPENRGRKVG